MPDVNGSRFHLLLSEDDWFGAREGQLDAPQVSGVSAPDLVWSSEEGLQLRGRIDFTTTDAPARLTADDLRGAARDRFGTWWEVGADRRSIVATKGGDRSIVWPPPPVSRTGPFKPVDLPDESADLGGLTVTSDHRLVVGVIGVGLLVFDLFAGGDPRLVDWVKHAGTSFSPIALSATGNGGFLVLDTARTPSSTARVWSLDAQLEPVATQSLDAVAVFASCVGEAEPLTPDEAPSEVTAVAWEHDLSHASAITALKQEHSYLLLNRAENEIVWCVADSIEARVSLDDALATRLMIDAPDTAVRGHDLAVVVEHEPDPVDGSVRPNPVLYISDQGGDRVFSFDWRAGDLEARADQFRLRRHAGKGLVAADGQAWFDTASSWHPLSSRARTHRATEGTLITAALDSGDLGCTWHRLFLDGCLPIGAGIRIETRAADTQDDLANAPWQTEPAPYLRRSGIELTHDLDVAPAVAGRTGTWETLLQQAVGRFCQMRLTLSGNGGVTPSIRALRLVFPRFSYLHEYLPRVFAERDEATGFFARYLTNPEGLLTDLEERIADAQLLFDSRTVPTEYLSWLATWFSYVFDEDLEPARRRLFLANAIQIFQERGTVQGIVRAVRLVLDDCPELAFDEDSSIDGNAFSVRVLENFNTRRLGVVVPDGPGEIGETIVTDPSLRWTPELGSAELHSRFRRFLTDRHGLADAGHTGTWLADRSIETLVVSATTPVDTGEAADWRDFLSIQLGVSEPDFTLGDVDTWRRFLLQRYTSIGRYRESRGGTAPSSFAAITVPRTLPATGTALTDWFDLITHVLPITAAAHRFTVLLPANPDEPEAEQLRQLALVRRVVEVQRPAHTSFEVRPYWASFRLGDARLGVDTQLGEDAGPNALVLGADRLAAAGIASSRNTNAKGTP